MSAQLKSEGYCWIRQSLSANDVETLRSIFTASDNQRLPIKEQSESFISALGNITKCVQSVLPDARPVRLVAFNKSNKKNWAVSWHQDRIISVCKKENVRGYSNWSRKAGLWHCEPPPPILENMLAVRAHLDEAEIQTGALEILSGSHQFGKVTADQINNVVDNCAPVTCLAKTGDLMIMKMLTLHRSKPSLRDAPRRAIRIDYSADILPTPLQWETGEKCE
ncbi:MAG: phytanoyl-CoA dioxygenase family protein [Hellea sp.]